jgi:WD40 repeat protein
MLTLELGRHHAAVRQVAVDAQERWVVTGSDDHTARVWDLRTGEQVRVLRLPNGDTGQDKIFGAAISPDGSLVAVGGWSGFEWDELANVYVFERATGRLLKRLGGLPLSVRHLAFSPDGARLLVCLGAGLLYHAIVGGMRVYRVSDWQELKRDDYANESTSGDFNRAGWIVVATSGGLVSLYEPTQLRRVAQVNVPKDGAYGAAFSPDGTRIAVGSGDRPGVWVLSAADLSVVRTPNVDGLVQGTFVVAWSKDGQYLLGTGEAYKAGKKAEEMVIRRWAGGGSFVDLPRQLVDEAILSMVPVSRGFVYGTFSGTWGVQTNQGRSVLHVSAPTADFTGSATRISQDGKRVTFGYSKDEADTLAFSLADRTIARVSKAAIKRDFYEAPDETRNIHLKPAQDADGLWLNGKKLVLPEDDGCFSQAIASDESFFILACQHTVTALDATGKRLWYRAAHGDPSGVNLSADDRFVTVPSGDGTIRWYRAADGTELLAFFPHADRRRWVAWTPSGFYAASAGGADLIGWHVNNGKDAPADFFPASTFRAGLYRPDVIARVIDTLDESQALDEADEAVAQREAMREESASAEARQTSPRPGRSGGVSANLYPPVVTLLSPLSGAAFDEAQITVRAQLRSPSHQPITSVQVLVDGRPVRETHQLTAVDPATNDGELLLGIPVPRKDCSLSVLASTSNAAGQPVTVHLRWTGHSWPPEVAPKLTLIAFDTARAPGAALARAVSRQQGRLFGLVHTKQLTGADATRSRLLKTLDALARTSSPQDVILLALAGRGETDPQTGLLQVAAADGSISAADLAPRLRSMAGRVLVLVDACGTNLDLDGFAEDLRSAENGAAVIGLSPSCGAAALEPALGEVLQQRGLTFDRLADQVHRRFHGGFPVVSVRPSAVPDFALTAP